MQGPCSGQCRLSPHDTWIVWQHFRRLKRSIPCQSWLLGEGPAHQQCKRRTVTELQLPPCAACWSHTGGRGCQLLQQAAGSSLAGEQRKQAGTCWGTQGSYLAAGSSTQTEDPGTVPIVSLVDCSAWHHSGALAAHSTKSSFYIATRAAQRLQYNAIEGVYKKLWLPSAGPTIQ